MSSETKPILYSFWYSTCAWRVRIALNLKKIDYETKLVNAEESRKHLESIGVEPDFALVPVLCIDDVVLHESLAIIEYLEEKYPDKRTVLPGTPEERAKIRALALQIIANTQPIQSLRVRQFFSAQDQRSAWANHWITVNFEKLEKALTKTAGKYSFGDNITLIDVCIPPQVNNAQRFGVDLSRFPTIMKINRELAKIPEFIAADSHHQPDTPEEHKK
ncbi:putative maleylacetoacetate isomerase 2 [Ditylenchus destructor]|uniref:maleylacetoacetate isomerase n=1 Tax=Ditylenchus destructor TaxID=166010 RepID=A0AAD4QR18_9BILA|nr:putative maleylacetoacetate isomerase 2 [Ditylenchus destructor]